MSSLARPGRRISVELLLGVSATLLSLAALVVSIVQTRISREQQHAAVWPFLKVGSGRVDDKFVLVLENKGVGPAIVKRVEIGYRGKAFPSLVALMNPELTGFVGPRFFVALRPGDVVKAGEELELFKIDRDGRKADRLSALVEEPTFLLGVTYADVYDNCWRATPHGVEPLPRCPSR
jgi:hypothetical protein